MENQIPSSLYACTHPHATYELAYESHHYTWGTLKFGGKWLTNFQKNKYSSEAQMYRGKKKQTKHITDMSWFCYFSPLHQRQRSVLFVGRLGEEHSSSGHPAATMSDGWMNAQTYGAHKASFPPVKRLQQKLCYPCFYHSLSNVHLSRRINVDNMFSSHFNQNVASCMHN